MTDVRATYHQCYLATKAAFRALCDNAGASGKDQAELRRSAVLHLRGRGLRRRDGKGGEGVHYMKKLTNEEKIGRIEECW